MSVVVAVAEAMFDSRDRVVRDVGQPAVPEHCAFRTLRQYGSEPRDTDPVTGKLYDSTSDQEALATIRTHRERWAEAVREAARHAEAGDFELACQAWQRAHEEEYQARVLSGLVLYRHERGWSATS